MKEKSVLIKRVLPQSIAEDAGIEEGDKILSINGDIVMDIFEYRFLTTNANLLIEIEKADGEIWEIEIEKDEYEDIGIEFEDLMLDDPKSCKNKCVFCFIDQMPQGMRDTLYFKDDDTRLSFFMGNYVTLTNIDYNDIDRIIKYRMSPINVSVHTTNPELRVFMLKNKSSGDILDKIKALVQGGITVNCQIVLCREINDGKELDNTITALSELYPNLNSISVVPVGITQYRENLHMLKPYDKNSAIEVIKQVENLQLSFLKKYQSRIVYLADEFYIMSDFDVPKYESYEDFPQIENGVGLIALMINEFENYIREINIDLNVKRRVSIATGVSSYKYIKQMANTLENKYKNLNVIVYKIKNNFFGENVTVTGLVTGGDIINQLSGEVLGEQLLISRSMLKADQDLFLDDYDLNTLEEKLGVSIMVVQNNGKDFVDKVLGVI
ncbi:UNVERIFIED_CONTAM: putative radical SAM enzyme (TIGR03279 family) [Acetivibrio alkalicellulosi]